MNARYADESLNDTFTEQYVDFLLKAVSKMIVDERFPFARPPTVSIVNLLYVKHMMDDEHGLLLLKDKYRKNNERWLAFQTSFFNDTVTSAYDQLKYHYDSVVATCETCVASVHAATLEKQRAVKALKLLLLSRESIRESLVKLLKDDEAASAINALVNDRQCVNNICREAQHNMPVPGLDGESFTCKMLNNL